MPNNGVVGLASLLATPKRLLWGPPKGVEDDVKAVVAPGAEGSGSFEAPNENPKVDLGVLPNRLEVAEVDVVVGAELCVDVIAPNRLGVFSDGLKLNPDPVVLVSVPPAGGGPAGVVDMPPKDQPLSGLLAAGVVLPG